MTAEMVVGKALEPRREFDPLARMAFGLGAACTALLLCAAALLPSASDMLLTSRGIGLGSGQVLLSVVVLASGVLAPGLAAAAIVLGVAALHRIRRARGSVRGFGWTLAAMGLALLPLEATVETVAFAWGPAMRLLL